MGKISEQVGAVYRLEPAICTGPDLICINSQEGQPEEEILLEGLVELAQSLREMSRLVPPLIFSQELGKSGKIIPIPSF